MARALANAAVRNYLVAILQALLVAVDRAQLVGTLKRAVVISRPLPGHALRRWHVAAALCTLLRVVRHVQQLTRILARRAHVHERTIANVGEDILFKGTDRGVIARHDRILARRDRLDVGRHRATLGNPLCATAIDEADILMAKQAKDPEGIRGPPVEVVAVDYDRRVARDAARRAHGSKALGADVIARRRVVEVEVPVDLLGAGNVARVKQQDVLVRLQHHETRRGQVVLEPLGRHETSRVGVRLELGVSISGERHRILE